MPPHHQLLQDCSQIVQQLELLEAVLLDLSQATQHIEGWTKSRSVRRNLCPIAAMAQRQSGANLPGSI